MNNAKKTFFTSLARLASALAYAAAIGFATVSMAKEPPTAPMLRMETGMHTAMINRMDVDRAEKLLVTGSRDKTVRLWDLDNHTLLKTLRLPIDAGNEGKVYAVAISPDGKTVAAGGWTEDDGIYLFDTTSGSLTGRISGLGSVINHLAFSADGRRLAATLGGRQGVRLYRRAGSGKGAWQLAGEDREYGTKSYWAAFSSDGRLLTTCYDGFLRLYDQQMKLLMKKRVPGGKKTFSAAFSPDGKRIAVGYRDTTAVDILDSSLNLLFAADTSGVDNGILSSVSWSQDGRFLYGAGMYYDGSGMYPICRWGDGGRGSRHELSGALDTIMGLYPLADGRLAFAAGDPAWGILNAGGRQEFMQQTAIGDFRDMFVNDGFRLSPNGREAAFGYKPFGEEPALFSVDQLALDVNPAISTNLSSPRTSASGMELTNWHNNYHPKLNGNPLELEPYEISRSRAFTPASAGNSFLLGTEWNLRSYNATGSLRWKQDIPEVAWAVNISGDGRLAVAAYGDGTIRWYRYADGKPLLTLFPHKDKKRWVAWTPSGYYAASIGGDELIGWHLNHGRDRTPDFFPASKFRSTYYRPDVVQKILITLDEKKAVQQANKENNRREDTTRIEDKLPPVIRLLSPMAGSGFSSDKITLYYALETPSGEPVTKIKALIDGVELSVPRAMQRKKKGEGRITIPVPQRDCEITIFAENRYAASVPASVRLQWQGRQKVNTAILPNLYLLAIGVGDYDDASLRLTFPGKDAKDFAGAIRKQKGKVYNDVQVRLLADEKASRNAIMDGLDWLERETTSNDIAILFLAGHGVNDRNGDYYFMPKDADNNTLRRNGIPYSVLRDIIGKLPGKKLFFVDTCFSGNIMGTRRGNGVDIVGIANELAAVNNRVVVFTSSTGTQYSLENSAWNNGAFTKAAVEGLGGKADRDGNSVISINELNLYIANRVKKLTRGQQTPAMAMPEATPDFPIAVQ